MVKRLKTIEYAFPALSSLTANTLTDLQQITIYIPESGVVFKSVIAELTCSDIITVTGGTVSKRLIALQIGASGYTTVDNTNAITNSGNNIWLFHSATFTNLFTTSWSGTSMTCDARVHMNQSTGTTLGHNNVCLKLIIMYEYEDTSGTQVKTVRIPFDSPSSGLYPGAGVYASGQVFDTLPALTTFLPESGVSIRDCFLEIKGNLGNAGATVDFTMSGGIGNAAFTGDYVETALTADSFYRYIWKPYSSGVLYFDSGNPQNFYLGCTVSGKFNHPASTLNVTYEYNASGTTTVLNSILLPTRFAGVGGGQVEGNRQQATTEFYIEEDAPIEIKKSALYLSYHSAGTMAGFSVKISGQTSGQAYKIYTNISNADAGSTALQRTCDDVITLNRGLNTLTAQQYRGAGSVYTAADFGGYWIINYTSPKHISGVGVHNNTNIYNIAAFNTLNATQAEQYTGNIVVPKPSGDYFVNSYGISCINIQNNAFSAPMGMMVQAQKLSGEGGPYWISLYESVNGQQDNDVGIKWFNGDINPVFKHYELDNAPNTISPFIARSWRLVPGNHIINSLVHLDLMYTTHGITHPITGTVVGYTGDGSNVVLDFYKASDHTHLFTITGATSGQVNTTWFDDTEQYYLTAKQGSYAGRSLDSSV